MLLAGAVATGESSYIGAATAFEVVSTLGTAYGGKYLYDKYSGAKSASKMPTARAALTRTFQRDSKRHKYEKSKARVASHRRKYQNQRQGGVIGRFNPTNGKSERKWHDVQFFTSAADFLQFTSPDLLTIPRNQSVNGRVGNKLILRTIQMQGHITCTPAVSPNGQPDDIFYMWYILDTQCNGVLPNPQEVFSTSVPAEGFLNIENSSRFRILKKVIYPMPSMAYDPTLDKWGQVTIPLNHYFRVRVPVRYTALDTSGILTNRTDMNVFICVAKRFSAVVGSIIVNGTVRMRFEDVL